MKEHLNVCIIAPNLNNTYSETFINDQIRRLPEKVFALYGAWLPYVQSNGQPTMNQNPIARAYRKGLRFFFRFSEQDLLSRALVSYLHKNKIDVVLAQYGLMGAGVMDCCVEARVPLVVHFHGFDAYAHHVWAHYGAQYLKMFRIANRIIAVSEDMKTYLSSRGCPKEKIVVNPCGVDTDFFSPPPEFVASPRFIAVARIVPVKGPTFTLRAFHLLWQQMPEATLTFVGDGELMDECREAAKSLGMENSVIFTGVLDSQSVLKMLRASRVFVQHSIKVPEVDSEGRPVSLLEASAAGLPVVVTRNGGLKESVIDGETGFLVEEGDIQSMASLMKKLALQDDLCRRMGQKGRDLMIRLYDFRNTIAALDQILRSASGN